MAVSEWISKWWTRADEPVRSGGREPSPAAPKGMIFLSSDPGAKDAAPFPERVAMPPSGYTMPPSGYQPYAPPQRRRSA